MPETWTWFPPAFYALCVFGGIVVAALLVRGWLFLHDSDIPHGTTCPRCGLGTRPAGLCGLCRGEAATRGWGG